jgi:DNA-binding transcriptional ArsR family regulator
VRRERGTIDKCLESGRIYAVDMPKRNGPGIELLADSTRRRIVTLLAAQPMRPSVIAQELGLSRPATSRQLRLLEDAGLVRGWNSMMDGRGMVYAIDPGALRPIIAWLAGTWTGVGWQPGDEVSTDRSV